MLSEVSLAWDTMAYTPTKPVWLENQGQSGALVRVSPSLAISGSGKRAGFACCSASERH